MTLGDGWTEEVVASDVAREADEVDELTGARLVFLAAGAQLFGCEFPDSLEHPVARRDTAVVGSDEGGPDEAPDRPDHGVGLAVVVGDDRAGTWECEAGREDRKPAECQPLGVGEQRVAPLDRGSECSVALGVPVVGGGE